MLALITLLLVSLTTAAAEYDMYGNDIGAQGMGRFGGGGRYGGGFGKYGGPIFGGPIGAPCPQPIVTLPYFPPYYPPIVSAPPPSPPLCVCPLTRPLAAPQPLLYFSSGPLSAPPTWSGRVLRGGANPPAAGEASDAAPAARSGRALGAEYAYPAQALTYAAAPTLGAASSWSAPPSLGAGQQVVCVCPVQPLAAPPPSWQPPLAAPGPSWRA